MLSNNSARPCSGASQLTPEAPGDAAQLAAGASSGASPPTPCTSGGAPAQRRYTFQRAWRLRRSEIHVLAGRADGRRAAARKWLVLADTTAFAERKEPTSEVAAGEDVKALLRQACCRRLRRTMTMEGMRLILAFLGLPCKWHSEQCTVAEFAAYVSRDVMAHIDLAAAARAKTPKRPLEESESEVESDVAEAPVNHGVEL
eukprot:10462543-Alexandrium_andersonii.AAC.1